jgi:hypothetical protein
MNFFFSLFSLFDLQKRESRKALFSAAGRKEKGNKKKLNHFIFS